MVIFPIISAIVSVACAAVIARDAIRRPRPDKLAWLIAFALFGIAAGTEALGSLTDWTVFLTRFYYLAGAVLVVGYLALGELYLLLPHRISRYAPGVTILVTAIAATIVFNAPVDQAKLAADGWEAIDRGPALVAITITINSLGTLVVAGGALYSAWRFRKLGTQRHRMIGCVLIAVGTVTVALGGTLTRFGHREYLYIAMAIGVAIIFWGYLETRRSEAPAVPAAAPATVRASLISLPGAKAAKGSGRAATDPAISFIVGDFLLLNDRALAEACRIWSVPRDDADAFTREEAQRVWALRLSLPAEAQTVFDGHGVPARRQLAEFYFDVLLAGSERANRG
ncbi:MAG: hypothetical protein ACJ789_03230 [Thermomicrobiales bacterium]